MKRVLTFITFLTLTLVSWAYDIKVGGIYYFVNAQNKTARVTSESVYQASYSGKVVIPSSIIFKGVSLKVTSIGASAFLDCKKLISVTIPNTVKYIENKAFENCISLTSITIPNSVVEIGESAFQNCNNLTSITIPQNVTRIGSYAFRWCSRLSTLKIYQNITYIGDWAFYGCKELKKVYLYFVSVPKSPDNIFDGAFVEFATLYVPSGTSNIIKSKYLWDRFSKIVELNDEFSKSLGAKAKQQQKLEEEKLAKQKWEAEGLARQKEIEDEEEIGEEMPVFPPGYQEALLKYLEENEEIFQTVKEKVTEKPEFPGGEEALLKFLAENIKYPEIAQEQGVQGRSIIEFMVNEDGSIVEPKVIRSLHPKCDEEAIRVIKAMPKWKPAINENGKPVRVKYTVPVQFKLT